MGPQGSGTDQAGIPPGERLLQGTPISLATQLGGTAFMRSKAAIETDGQHQPDRGALGCGTLRLHAVNQTATTASRAAGDISNCGASA